MTSNWKFLAGLGAGLVLASLLCLNWQQPLDELTIISRARTLGMVFPKEGPLKTSEPEAELHQIQLEPKMTAKQIAALLKREGIITAEEPFLAAVQEKHLAHRFIAGKYLLGKAWPMDKLLSVLTGKS